MTVSEFGRGTDRGLVRREPSLAAELSQVKSLYIVIYITRGVRTQPSKISLSITTGASPKTMMVMPCLLSAHAACAGLAVCVRANNARRSIPCVAYNPPCPRGYHCLCRQALPAAHPSAANGAEDIAEVKRVPPHY